MGDGRRVHVQFAELAGPVGTHPGDAYPTLPRWEDEVDLVLVAESSQSVQHCRCRPPKGGARRPGERGDPDPLNAREWAVVEHDDIGMGSLPEPATELRPHLGEAEQVTRLEHVEDLVLNGDERRLDNGCHAWRDWCS
jgi:hypothetical protein